jgi:hypothetical protein
MRFAWKRKAFDNRSFVRMASFVCFFLSPQLCSAGSITYSISVPKHPFEKSSPGGWGALVITFDKPASSTSFIFTPKCDTPTPGAGEPSSDGLTWQLGPGGYKLLPTGSKVKPDDPKSPVYGAFLVTVNFVDDEVPKVASAFWQSKLTTGKPPETTWTFVPHQDMMAKVSDFSTVPEPSSLTLAIIGALIVPVALRVRTANRAARVGPTVSSLPIRCASYH